MTNKDYISKESVLQLIEHSKNEPYLDGVDALIAISMRVLDLPTFSPEAIIEEMIEEEKNYRETLGEGYNYIPSIRIKTLEIALSRIRAENIS